MVPTELDQPSFPGTTVVTTQGSYAGIMEDKDKELVRLTKHSQPCINPTGYLTFSPDPTHDPRNRDGEDVGLGRGLYRGCRL